jgi:hypothetical protein
VLVTELIDEGSASRRGSRSSTRNDIVDLDL